MQTKPIGIARHPSLSMNLFAQILNDLKAAQAANANEKPPTEAMPAFINERPYFSAAHILLPSREEAEALQTKIEAGELSFEAAASQYSVCKSKFKKGYLGPFKSLARILFLPYEGRYGAVAPFDDVVFDRSRDLDAISIVTTEFGSHIVKVCARDVKV